MCYFSKKSDSIKPNLKNLRLIRPRFLVKNATKAIKKFNSVADAGRLGIIDWKRIISSEVLDQ